MVESWGMTLESEVFKKKYPDLKKLVPFGFKEENGTYYYSEEIMHGDFRAEVIITSDCAVTGHCIDIFSEEEYQPIRIVGNTGAYAAEVREAYVEVLQKIADECCMDLPFVSMQANRIAMDVLLKFRDKTESIFEKHPEIGVFRNPENAKWYGIIMQVDAKLFYEGAEGQVEVIDIKADPEEVNRLVQKKGYYPAYHMNKKNWFTVVLDDTIPDDAIMDALAISRGFTLGKKAAHAQSEERVAWLIPSNPLHYDIVGHMEVEDITDWKQTSSVKPGDTVYMYVGKPYSSIMYKFTAIETDRTWIYDPYPNKGTRLMILKREESYDPRICTLTKMKQFGVTTVRGPRYMPKALIEYLDKNKGKDPQQF